MIAVTRFSVSIFTQALTRYSLSPATYLARPGARFPGRRATPITRAEVPTTAAVINPLRVHLPILHLLRRRLGVMHMDFSGCNLVNGPANSRIHATAADVAGHRQDDIPVARRWMFFQQSHGCQNLTGLTVAALRYLFVDPGLLHRASC